MKYYIIATFFFIVSFSLSANTIWYVRQNATTGLQNGQDWANAFTDLQLAIAAAQSGDQIWVAGGYYLPTHNDDRNISFELKKGVRMYGGFQGQETQISQRIPSAPAAILSGDIGIPDKKEDNSYHVLYGKGLDGTTVVDGFTITKGQAIDATLSGSPQTWGGGLFLVSAFVPLGSDPVFQNCRFEYNRADYGGAVCADWQDQSPINPVFRHCTFKNNFATYDGAGIYKVGPGRQGEYKVEHCVFEGNRNFIGCGGGLFLTKSFNTTNKFIGCLFSKDTSFWGAGFCYKEGMDGKDSSRLSLDSCIFMANTNRNGQGGGFAYGQTIVRPDAIFECRINNCIFDNNLGEGAACNFEGGIVYLNINNCIFRNNIMKNNGVIKVTNAKNIAITNSKFFNNKKSSTGAAVNGAIYIGCNGNNTHRIENCIFANNSNAVLVGCPESSSTETYITNCTFYQNEDYAISKAWYASYDNANYPYYNKCYVKNCIFTEKVYIGQIFYNANLGAPFFPVYQYYADHCLFNVEEWQKNVRGGEAAFGLHNIFDATPQYFSTTNSDFRLKTCSKGINAGDNAAVENLDIVADIAGNPRILHKIVDMGAYEQADSCESIAVKPLLAPKVLKLLSNPSDEGTLAFVLDTDGATTGIVSIVNTTGIPVFRQSMLLTVTPVVVNAASLPVGIYQVMVCAGNNCYTAKWIKI